MTREQLQAQVGTRSAPNLATSLLDRLFTPHGASAYFRWLGRDTPNEQVPTPTSGTVTTKTVTRSPRPTRVPARVDIVADPCAVVTFSLSGQSATAEGTLLETAEAAGLEPRFRCRRGICGTCTTHKTSGTVLDVRTGEVSDTPGPIRLCVTVPHNDVHVDL